MRASAVAFLKAALANYDAADGRAACGGRNRPPCLVRKIDGTAVYNTADDRLGDVHHVMIDKYTGQVDYAVMSFGGFLGIGESYHPLPWDKLTYDTGLGGYVVDIEARQLEAAPRYTASNRTGPTPAIAAASV